DAQARACPLAPGALPEQSAGDRKMRRLMLVCAPAAAWAAAALLAPPSHAFPALRDDLILLSPFAKASSSPARRSRSRALTPFSAAPAYVPSEPFYRGYDGNGYGNWCWANAWTVAGWQWLDACPGFGSYGY
ncbi:MAG TPA: hypothetical protein VFF88_07815, partial [Methylocella sp.]|nr:hypothetical protein [Methylocella sp.]